MVCPGHQRHIQYTLERLQLLCPKINVIYYIYNKYEFKKKYSLLTLLNYILMNVTAHTRAQRRFQRVVSHSQYYLAAS
jgi:hypothetical protein